MFCGVGVKSWKRRAPSTVCTMSLASAARAREGAARGGRASKHGPPRGPCPPLGAPQRTRDGRDQRPVHGRAQEERCT